MDKLSNSSTKNALRIAFVSSSDPLDIHSFSGTLYHMAQALQAVVPQLEIVRRTTPFWFSYMQRLIEIVSKGRVNVASWPILNRHFSSRLSRRWEGQRVVFVTVVASSLAAELSKYAPVIHISDATPELLLNLYPDYPSLTDSAAALAEKTEGRCIRRAVHNSFASDWAAASAISHYGADPNNVSVIPWGCNIADVPATDLREGGRTGNVCKLLFVGVGWLRKGGDVVCDAARMLVERGIPIQLDLVGSIPPDSLAQPPWMVAHGFLNKNNEEDTMLMRSLMREADFLFVPSRQEAYGIVFAEASAYGTPSVTRNVGGVSTVVKDGKNGIILNETATPEDFANAIEKTWLNRSGYIELRKSTRRRYEKHLNWSAWAAGIADQLGQLAQRGKI
jgi:glycosyltransferase involved in cell wall biosynthesis